MAVYQALLLNTVVPQIQAAQAGDSYVMVVNSTTPALRITQTGTGNALEVEDSANPDATPFVVTAAGDVGIGLSSPTGVFNIKTSNGQFLVQNGTSAAQMRISAFNNAGNANAALIFEGYTSEYMRLDASGNLGLGVTPSAAMTTIRSMQLGYSGIIAGQQGTAEVLYLGSNWYFDGAFKYQNNGFATRYDTASGEHVWRTAASGTAGNAITFTQAMTLDASGNLLVGATSALGSAANRGNITVNGTTDSILSFGNGASLAGYILQDSGGMTVYSSGATYQRFYTNNTERARITSGGDLLVGTTNTDPVGSNVTGHAINSTGVASHSRSEGVVLYVNRKTDDGVLVGFYQDGTAEGDISVSGTTVSYNGGHLSRWAQMLDKPLLLKGTVMSNLNEMNEYYKDGQPVANEQLNKVKVSDVEGDPNVAGVFVNWGHDEAHDVDEINMAMTGDMIIRIAQGVTVARGDLLMSAGDGTAKPQGDDIVRSKTVAKVTSTHVTCTYADGSYCVPCVLMAC
jgi:hypothetical protein